MIPTEELLISKGSYLFEVIELAKKGTISCFFSLNASDPLEKIKLSQQEELRTISQLTKTNMSISTLFSEEKDVILREKSKYFFLTSLLTLYLNPFFIINENAHNQSIVEQIKPNSSMTEFLLTQYTLFFTHVINELPIEKKTEQKKDKLIHYALLNIHKFFRMRIKNVFYPVVLEYLDTILKILNFVLKTIEDKGFVRSLELTKKMLSKAIKTMELIYQKNMAVSGTTVTITSLILYPCFNKFEELRERRDLLLNNMLGELRKEESSKNDPSSGTCGLTGDSDNEVSFCECEIDPNNINARSVVGSSLTSDKQDIGMSFLQELIIETKQYTHVIDPSVLFRSRLFSYMRKTNKSELQICFILCSSMFENLNNEKYLNNLILSNLTPPAVKDKSAEISDRKYNIANIFKIILDETFARFFLLFENIDETEEEIQKLKQIICNPLFITYMNNYCDDILKKKWLIKIINCLDFNSTKYKVANRDLIANTLFTFSQKLIPNIDINSNNDVLNLNTLLKNAEEISKSENYTPETKEAAKRNSLFIIEQLFNKNHFKILKAFVKKGDVFFYNSFIITEIELKNTKDDYDLRMRITFFKLFLNIRKIIVEKKLSFNADVNFDPHFIRIEKKTAPNPNKKKEPAVAKEQLEQLFKTFECSKLHAEKNKKGTGITIAIDPNNPTPEISSEFWENLGNLDFTPKPKPNVNDAKEPKNKKKIPNHAKEKPIQLNLEEHHDVEPEKESAGASALAEPKSSELTTPAKDGATPETHLIIETPIEQKLILPVVEQTEEPQIKQVLISPDAQATETPTLPITQYPNLSTEKKEQTKKASALLDTQTSKAQKSSPVLTGLFCEIGKLTDEIVELKKKKPAETGIYTTSIKREMGLLLASFNNNDTQFNENFLKECHKALTLCYESARILCKSENTCGNCDNPTFEELLNLANSISSLLSNLKKDLTPKKPSTSTKLNCQSSAVELSKKPKSRPTKNTIAKKLTTATTSSTSKSLTPEPLTSTTSSTSATTLTQEPTQTPILVAYNNEEMTATTSRLLTPESSTSTTEKTTPIRFPTIDDETKKTPETTSSTSATTPLSTKKSSPIRVVIVRKDTMKATHSTPTQTPLLTETVISSKSTTSSSSTSSTSTSLQSRNHLGTHCAFFSGKPVNYLPPPSLTETAISPILTPSKSPILKQMMEKCRRLAEVNPTGNVACLLLVELYSVSKELYPSCPADRIVFFLYGGQPRRILQETSLQKCDVDIGVFVNKFFNEENLKDVIKEVWRRKGYNVKLNRQEIPSINGGKPKYIIKIKSTSLSNDTSNCQFTFPLVDFQMINETVIDKNPFEIQPGINYDQYYMFLIQEDNTQKFLIFSPYNDDQISAMKKGTIFFTKLNEDAQYNTIEVVLEQNPTSALRAIYFNSTDGNKLYWEPDFWPIDAVTETAGQFNAADSIPILSYISYFSRAIKCLNCDMEKFFDTLVNIKLLPKTLRDYFIPFYNANKNFFYKKLNAMRENGFDYDCLMAIFILLPLAENYCNDSDDPYIVLIGKLAELKKSDPDLFKQDIDFDFDKIYAYLTPLIGDLRETRETREHSLTVRF